MSVIEQNRTESLFVKTCT